MSGHPDPGDHPMTVVRDTDPATIALAETNVARRAQAGGWSRAELVDVLEHLGLRAPVKPTGGKTTPIGGNLSPAVQQRRRDQKNARKREARAVAKDEDTS